MLSFQNFYIMKDELKYKNVVNEYGSKPLRISHPLFVYNGFEGSSKPVYISYPE